MDENVPLRAKCFFLRWTRTLVGIAQEKYNMRMSASGRKLRLKSRNFTRVERPLSMKADIELGTREIGLSNDRFTPESGRSRIIG